MAERERQREADMKKFREEKRLEEARMAEAVKVALAKKREEEHKLAQELKAEVQPPTFHRFELCPGFSFPRVLC